MMVITPVFTKFLQSGMARVVVPLRPGFEASVFNYLKTGLVWNGAGLPTIGDPLFVDILTEMQEAANIPQQGIEIASWEYKLPTNLVLLQNDAAPAEGEGLPCNHEDEEG